MQLESPVDVLFGPIRVVSLGRLATVILAILFIFKMKIFVLITELTLLICNLNDTIVGDA
mgnify:CR=1 FL=1